MRRRAEACAAVIALLAACATHGPPAPRPTPSPPLPPWPTMRTGFIQGTVIDAGTHVPMLLVTVVATSPSLEGTRSEFSDASGQYVIDDLPPGTYTLRFFYGPTRTQRAKVSVRAGRVTEVDEVLEQRTLQDVVLRDFR